MLTAVPCDCCDGVFVDEVGLALVIEGILNHGAALRAKAEHDRAEWARAFEMSDRALIEARK